MLSRRGQTFRGPDAKVVLWGDWREVAHRPYDWCTGGKDSGCAPTVCARRIKPVRQTIKS
jgi:hypothetical protein